MNARPDVQPESSVQLSDPVSERALLGAVILHGRGVELLRQHRDKLYSERHRVIADAVIALNDAGVAIDLATLRAELDKTTGRLETVGGAAYLADLIQGVPRSTNVEHYADAVANRAQRRDVVLRARGLIDAALEGATDGEVAELAEGLYEEAAPRRRIVASNLYGADIEPAEPEYLVENFILRAGLHLWWAAPSGLKTYTLLHIVHELLSTQPPKHLLGHPKLPILAGWRRVLWISTEETTGRLRWRAEKILRGMGNRELGEIIHVFASARPRVTLDDLSALLDAYGLFDAIILDSLTGLRPKARNGVRVQWDLDNDAANELLLDLRALAAEREVAIFIIHHSDKKVTNFRGPTDWWASADVMVGLLGEAGSTTSPGTTIGGKARSKGRVRVWTQKVRDGRVPTAFYLLPEFGEGTVEINYDGEARADGDDLRPSDRAILAALRTAGAASQATLAATCDLDKGTVSKRCRVLAEKQLIEQQDTERGSPAWVAVEHVLKGCLP